MLKVLVAVLMAASAYVGVFTAYLLVRYKVKVYTGEYLEHVLESATYRGWLPGDTRTLVSETTEPREITYTLGSLILEAAKSFTLIALAVWLGTRLFAR